MPIKKTLDEFKNDINKKFGEEYTVLGSEYKNNKTPILLKHNICNNSFEVRPDLILNNYKTGCPFCSKNKLKTHEKFIEEFKETFKDEYTVLGIYINADTPIKVKHNLCGKEREVLPHRLLKGDSCLFCFGSPKRTIESIRSELKDKNIQMELISEEYKGNKYPITFKCLKCQKTFKARPNDILSVNRKECPHCSKRKISKAELIIKNILEKNNINFETQKGFKDLTVQGPKKKKRLRYDFLINLNNEKILLEFDGEQHFHSTGRFTVDDVEKIHNHDVLKNEYAIKNNIKLMRITFKDYKNIHKIMNRFISSTTIPDECKVVDSSGSKDSAALWNYYNVDNIV